MGIRWQEVCILAALCVLASGPPAGAADQTVLATSANTFTPDDVTVDVGDTVTWNNAGGFHNVAFDDGSFIAPNPATSDAWSVARTFTAPGTFTYNCEIHVFGGMVGRVTVNAAATAPDQLRASLALAYKPCTTPNRVHGAPVAVPTCAPPVQVSDYLTVGTADSNSRATRSTGFVRVRTEPGDSATPADEANVRLDASISDVRSKVGLSDYTGELQAVLPLRITDSSNGTPATERATGDTTFTFTIPCSPTADASVGSDCGVMTTADAVAPGAVVEGKQAVWEVNEVKVMDGGSDGLVATPNNTVFMSQAVFVP